jgi:hypothetical protein
MPFNRSEECKDLTSLDISPEQGLPEPVRDQPCNSESSILVPKMVNSRKKLRVTLSIPPLERRFCTSCQKRIRPVTSVTFRPFWIAG